MRSFDLSPLMRSGVGFDHLNRMLDAALNAESGNAYPPYNIEKLSQDSYRVTMAVAGFKPEDLNISVEDGTLTLSGRTADEENEREFLHRGIATRAFERRFQLADTIQVGSATYEHGLLAVDLTRVVPDHKKPRQIPINGAAPARTSTTIDGEAE